MSCSPNTKSTKSSGTTCDSKSNSSSSKISSEKKIPAKLTTTNRKPRATSNQSPSSCPIQEPYTPNLASSWRIRTCLEQCWIPIEARKPETNSEVLVIEGEYHYTAFYLEDGTFMSSISQQITPQIIENVTHWQPLTIPKK